MSDDKDQPVPDWQMDPDIVPEPLPVPDENAHEEADGPEDDDAEGR